MRGVDISIPAKAIEEESHPDDRAAFAAIVLGIGRLVLRHGLEHRGRRAIRCWIRAIVLVNHFLLPAVCLPA
ncbi:hypothetical protein G6F55_014631 [Rhizopus delemar]|jgi:hypothetical protein|nr:hypothetical protein G6F55_014631 [Rhizopus delemar]